MRASTSSRWRTCAGRRSATPHASISNSVRALGLDWIRSEIERLAVDGHWQAVARGTLREDAYALHRRLTEQVLARSRRGDPAARVSAWLDAGGTAVDNLARTVGAMRAGGGVDFPTLSVALQSVRRLTER